MPKSLIEQLFDAIENKEIKKSNILLSKLKTNPTILEARNSHNKTLLHTAAELGNKDCVSALIEARADLELPDENGETALFTSVAKQKIDSIRLLLDAKANPDAQNVWKVTPLMRAAAIGNTDCVNLLLAGRANPSHKDEDHDTPLLEAISGGSLDCVRSLVAAKANLDDQNIQGYSALHRAAASSHHDILSYLIEEKASVNICGNLGYTALHYSAEHQKLTNMELLVFNGAHCNIRAFQGETPLDLAMRTTNNATARFLLAHTDISAEQEEKINAFFTKQTVDKIRQFKIIHAKNIYQAIDKGTSEKAQIPTAVLDIVHSYTGFTLAEFGFKDPKLAFFKPSKINAVLKLEEKLAKKLSDNPPEKKKNSRVKNEVFVKTYELRSKSKYRDHEATSPIKEPGKKPRK